MPEFDEFDERPDSDSLDDRTCRHATCDRLSTRVIRYWNPTEYVVYCREHAAQHQGHDRAKRVLEL